MEEFILSRTKNFKKSNNYLNNRSSYPRKVYGVDNINTEYYKRNLWNIIYSIFDFENIPEYWDINYIKDVLYREGYITVVEYNGDAWALRGGLAGVNLYNKPTDILISNPVIGGFSRKIGKDGEIVYLNILNNKPYSIAPLVQHYAELLAQIDRSINTSLINSRVAHIYECETDADVATIQKAYDMVSYGQPMVAIKKGTGMIAESRVTLANVKNTYIGNDLLLTKRTIMNEFLTAVGINNRNTDKKERLITDEANRNNREIARNVGLWLENLTACFDRVNKLFGLNIKVKLKNRNEEKTEEEGEKYELAESD